MSQNNKTRGGNSNRQRTPKVRTIVVPLACDPKKSTDLQYPCKKTLQIGILGNGQEDILVYHPTVPDSEVKDRHWALSRPRAYEAYKKNRVHPGMPRVYHSRSQFSLEKYCEKKDNPLKFEEGRVLYESGHDRIRTITAAQKAASEILHREKKAEYKIRIDSMKPSQKKPKAPARPTASWNQIYEVLDEKDARDERGIREYLDLKLTSETAKKQFPDLQVMNRGCGFYPKQNLVNHSKDKNIGQVRNLIVQKIMELSFPVPLQIEEEGEEQENMEWDVPT